MNLSQSAEIRNKEYRHGLVSAQIEIDLPLQIRALRKQLVGTQPELSRLTGMKQPRISAMEKPGGAHFTLETLRRLAEAFDVALIVRFAPFSELLDWSGRFNPDTFGVPSFADEIAKKHEIEKSAATAATMREEAFAALVNETNRFAEMATQASAKYQAICQAITAEFAEQISEAQAPLLSAFNEIWQDASSGSMKSESSKKQLMQSQSASGGMEYGRRSYYDDQIAA
jgi:transcriptional regulator with XRE-family HTH domain